MVQAALCSALGTTFSQLPRGHAAKTGILSAVMSIKMTYVSVGVVSAPPPSRPSSSRSRSLQIKAVRQPTLITAQAIRQMPNYAKMCNLRRPRGLEPT